MTHLGNTGNYNFSTPFLVSQKFITFFNKLIKQNRKIKKKILSTKNFEKNRKILIFANLF